MKKVFLVFSALMLTLFCLASPYRDSLVHTTRIYKKVDSVSLIVHIFHDPKRASKELKPAIAFFHGGGWAYGNPSEFFGACRRYAAMGFVTFSFQYRLSIDKDGKVPHPILTPIECVKDARSAMRWVKSHAKEFNIDPQKIVAGGQSVGGHLVLSTAMIDSHNESTDDLSVNPTPNAMLLYSGTVNTMEAWCDMLMGKQREQIWSISPAHNVKKGLPPIAAFHGDDDNIVPIWTVMFFQNDMNGAGNHFELNRYPGRKHYLGDIDEKFVKQYSRLFDEQVLLDTDKFLKQFGFIQGE
jgi:acetyl esterase/lipase